MRKILSEEDCFVDHHFLKQRFAFFFSLATIIPDYKKEIVKKKRIIQRISEIGQADTIKGNDSFLMSVYKDFFGSCTISV